MNNRTIKKMIKSNWHLDPPNPIGKIKASISFTPKKKLSSPHSLRPLWLFSSSAVGLIIVTFLIAKVYLLSPLENNADLIDSEELSAEPLKFEYVPLKGITIDEKTLNKEEQAKFIELFKKIKQSSSSNEPTLDLYESTRKSLSTLKINVTTVQAQYNFYVTENDYIIVETVYYGTVQKWEIYYRYNSYQTLSSLKN